MGVPKFFSEISVKAGNTYTTTNGVIVVTRCYQQKIPDAGKKLFVDYTLDGTAQEPLGQYQFKKMVAESLEKPIHSPKPTDPPEPAPNDPPEPPAPQDPPPPPPSDPPAPNPPEPPKPKERGMFDWMEDLYDWLFK